MGKCYKSSSFATEFWGTRTEAIQKAIQFFSGRLSELGIRPDTRYTFRANDDSGFTIGFRGGVTSCVNKWNKSRNA